MSGGRSESDSSTLDLTPEEFKGIRGPLADLFRTGVIPGFESAIQGFQGVEDLDRFRAPITTGETMGIERLRGQLGLSESEQLSQDLINRTLRGEFLTPGGANPALRDVVRFTTQNINEQFDAQDLEARSLFARAGQSLPESSPFAQAQAESNVGRLDAIGESTSNILFGAFEAERGRQVQAEQAAQTRAQFEFAQAQEVLQAEALPRLVDQLGLDKGLQEFENRLANLTSALGLAAASAGPALGAFGSSKSSQGGLSSIEYKREVGPISDPLERLMQLVPVHFRYKANIEDGGERVHQGLIAEQAEQHVPEVVWHDDHGGAHGIHYPDLVAMMLSGMQSQQRTIEALERRVAELRGV